LKSVRTKYRPIYLPASPKGPTISSQAVDWALTIDRADAIGARARARIEELHPEMAGARLVEAYSGLVEEAALR
jgi:hypothetical protein